MCGGTDSIEDTEGGFIGLSPRVRGNRNSPSTLGAPLGSIPACAGEPAALRLRSRSHSVYPRVCGGTETLMDVPVGSLGLSPRVRGNQPCGGVNRADGRSIPACAGEPEGLPGRLPPWPVYPRVCGGTEKNPPMPPMMGGLSPRVRGNPQPTLGKHGP